MSSRARASGVTQFLHRSPFSCRAKTGIPAQAAADPRASLTGALADRSDLEPALLLEPLAFSRDAIAAGEVWRLLTAAFAHLSWWHLAGNLVALALITRLLQPYASGLEMLGAFAIAALAATLGLYFGSDIVWYAGASAALYGLLAWGTTRLPMPAGFGLLAALAVMTVLDRQRTTSWMGEPVVVSSHYWGIVGGLGFALVSMAARVEAGRINAQSLPGRINERDGLSGTRD